jgi:hypothetical protein
MDKTIDMAREAGFETKRDMVFVDATEITPTLKAFEALVRADEREIVMNEPLTKAQWQRFEDEIRADERAKLQPKKIKAVQKDDYCHGDERYYANE